MIFSDKGIFVFRGTVEDSATAEISRWQIWQWIYHKVRQRFAIDNSMYRLLNVLVQVLLEDNRPVTRELVFNLTDLLTDSKNKLLSSAENSIDVTAVVIFKEMMNDVKEPPVFITTFLRDRLGL